MTDSGPGTDPSARLPLSGADVMGMGTADRPGGALGALKRSVPVLALFIGAPLLGVWILAANGSLAASVVPVFGDPGAATIWGLPLARGFRDVAATLTIGCLVTAAVVIPPRPAAGFGDLGVAQVRLVTTAAIAGFAWAWAGFAVLALTYSELSGRPVLTPGLVMEVTDFATRFETGRLLFAHAVLVGLVAVGALFARRVMHLGLLALLALVALWPLASSGHAAGSASHDLVVNTQFVHLVAVTVWVGGLAGLYLALRQIGDGLAASAARFSSIAGACYVALFASGLIATSLRLDTWSDLGSSYGVLLLVKAAVLACLGLAGWRQRKRILPALADDGRRARAFASLAGLELTLMAVAIGTAVALGATPPPATDRVLTTAESLLGYPMPGPLTAAEWFTGWRVDSLWTPLAILAAAAYLAGVSRLRRRGDRWPWGRTVCWLVACTGLVWATSGAPGMYGDVLFSMHMVQHMTIATAVPTFLCLGAPITLALRALRRRTDGSRGTREWLLIAVHSRLLRFLSNPLVAAALFIVGLVAFYYSNLFELSMRSHTAHVLMVGHFLLTGYLFANVIVGIDPGPVRPPYPLRMLLLMVVFGFHAFFSVSLMSSSVVLAESWYSALDRGWGRGLAEDQYVGASLGWALGDYPLAILAGGLITAWVRADHREGRRLDRQAERDNDAALRQYNAYLGRLGDRAGTGQGSTADGSDSASSPHPGGPET